MKQRLSLILCLLALNLFAQDYGCDGSRYINSQFEVASTTNIVFGNNFDVVSNSDVDLAMNVYYPKNDNITARPLLVLAFGGAFIEGNKESLNNYCIDYASRGYVVATIDYRLTTMMNLVMGDSALMKGTVIDAMHDMKAAVRYLKDDYANGNTFSIDTSLIVMGGYSAGAITALHAGLIHESSALQNDVISIVNSKGGINGNTNNLQYSTKPMAILSFAGAIDELDYVVSGAPVIMSMHNEGDQVVPYYHNHPFASMGLTNLPKLNGPGVYHQYALNKGITSHLKTVPASATSGDDHMEFLNTTYYDTAMIWSTQIIHDLVCTTQEIKPSAINNISFYPNPASDFLLVSDDKCYDAKYEIVNAIGQIVMEGYLVNEPIDIQQLELGCYSLIIRNEFGVNSGRFIKN